MLGPRDPTSSLKDGILQRLLVHFDCFSGEGGGEGSHYQELWDFFSNYGHFILQGARPGADTRGVKVFLVRSALALTGMSEAETWTVEHECKLCRFSKAKHTNSDFHSLWIVTKKEAGVQFTMIERK